MHPKHLFLASLVGSATAISNNAGMAGSCNTVLGSKSIKSVPTVTETCHITNTVKSTVYNQKTITVTPKLISDTSITTVIATVTEKADPKTTEVKVLATAYESSTSTADTTTITQVGATSTVTSTKNVATVIPAPSSFRPVQDTLPGGSLILNVNTPFKRDTDLLESRGSENRGPNSGSLLARKPKKLPGNCKPISGYPNKVECSVTSSIQQTLVTTKTKSPLIITAAAPVTTITKTSTITSTTTSFPADVTVMTTSTTTSIIDQTVTPSFTTTITSTTTQTQTLVTATNYAICSSRNFADSRNNIGYISGFVTPPNYTVKNVQTSGPYECCVQCASNPLCLAAGFLDGIGCYMFQNSPTTSCSSSNVCGGSLYWYGNFAGGGYVIMNGHGRQFDTFASG